MRREGLFYTEGGLRIYRKTSGNKFKKTKNMQDLVTEFNLYNTVFSINQSPGSHIKTKMAGPDRFNTETVEQWF